MLKGVAAMIEVARALVKSECQLKYSVIFVAFDKEEVGVMMCCSTVTGTHSLPQIQTSQHQLGWEQIIPTQIQTAS